MRLFSGHWDLVRTLIINAITASVAAGLLRNLRDNPDLEPANWPGNKDAPVVEMIVPARNEVANIEALLTCLVAQHYPASRFHITVVDDNSEDGTAAVVERIAATGYPVALVKAGPLPRGWTGKNHAMFTGCQSTSSDSEYLLFLDADTRHSPLMLPTLISRASETQADLLSLVVRAQLCSIWEKVLVPQVGELYALLVGTMNSVNRGRAVAANGQCLLIRREIYAELGASDEVRGNVAEDRALAAACKERGYQVRLENGRHLVHGRFYSGLSEMWAGYSKTLFWAGGRNVARTLAVATALALYAFTPLAGLSRALLEPHGRSRRKGLTHATLQLLPMMATRLLVCRQMEVPPAYVLAYPLAVGLGDVLLLHSLWLVVTGKGVRWKGRTYNGS